MAKRETVIVGSTSLPMVGNRQGADSVAPVVVEASKAEPNPDLNTVFDGDKGADTARETPEAKKKR